MDNQESKFDEWGVKRRITKVRKKRDKLSIEVKKSRLEDWGLSMTDPNPTWKRSVSWRILAGVFGLMFGLFVFIIKLIFSIGAGAEQAQEYSGSNDHSRSSENPAFHIDEPSPEHASESIRTPINSLPNLGTENNRAFQEHQAYLDNDIDFFRNG